MTIRPRVYLAGPDVFRPDSAEHFAVLATSCEALGLEAARPSDGLMPAWYSDEETAKGICKENIDLIRQCHGVVANLIPFRGIEPDSGTAFEVGVAIALGIPVVAYGIPRVPYAERVGDEMHVVRVEDGTLRDSGGWLVEDLGLPMNLMLSCSVDIASSVQEALEVLARRLHVSKLR